MIPLRANAHIHLIAACGTAMGSLAGMLLQHGYRVTGSDSHVYPPMSDFLREEGIDLFSGFDAGHLLPAPDLVVVGRTGAGQVAGRALPALGRRQPGAAGEV